MSQTAQLSPPPLSPDLPCDRPQTERVSVLDGLRGYAVLLVMANHFFGATYADDGPLKWPFRFFQSGWMGVDLFFVLSGFLITGILWDTRTRPHYFRNFYARRTLRIFPLYYGTLLLVLLILPRFSQTIAQSLPQETWWLWTYTVNYGLAYTNGWQIFNTKYLMLAHFWSLAVEEHFYLLWPTAVRFLRWPLLLTTSLCLIVLAILARVAFFLIQPTDPLPAYLLTPCRMDSLILGAGIALVAKRYGIARLLIPALLVAPLTLGILGYWFIRFGRLEATGNQTSIFSYTLLALGFASLLVLVLNYKAAPLIRWLFASKPILFYGKYSYALYVLHALMIPLFWQGPIATAIRRFIPNYTCAELACALVWLLLASLAAYASWHLYEKHFLKLKDRFA